MDVVIRRVEVAEEPVDEGDSFWVDLDEGTEPGFGVQFMLDSDYDLGAGLDADPYCIHIGGTSFYGWITRAVIDRGTLEIRVSDAAVNALGVSSGNWRFSLEISDADFAALRYGLNRVLRSIGE